MDYLERAMVYFRNSWFESFLTNVAVYAILVIPGCFLVNYYKKAAQANANFVNGFGPLSSILKCCILGDMPAELEIVEEGGNPSPPSGGQSEASGQPDKAIWKTALKLLACIVGLQASYLTWGVIQERVITKSYDGEKFTDSQFLVFINRVLALLVSGTIIQFSKQPRHVSPFYKYSYSSISNILSSWCQYEALKYISFPTQVLGKSCKVIPVMIMGKIVSNKTYPIQEYVTAIMISLGVSIFLLATDASSDKNGSQTTIAGVIILCGYLVFDSFTSNWQSELFKEYNMSSIQMMFGVNVFSFTFTSFSLLIRGTLFSSLSFLVNHLEFALHALVLSVCSATGQLFIFYTISSFGPVIFTLIMTCRQAVAIILSCILYGHSISFFAAIGVVIVFSAILLKIYLKQTQSKK